MLLCAWLPPTLAMHAGFIAPSAVALLYELDPFWHHRLFEGLGELAVELLPTAW